MLRCPCEVFRPLTLATAKKPPTIRHSSVLRFPVGCSCYHRKSIFLHIERHKEFSRREWEIKSFLKEQKNFIWTSILFLKNKGDKNNITGNDTNCVSNKKSDTSESSNTKLSDSLKDNNFSESSLKSTTSGESPTNTLIFGSIDSVENTELGSKDGGIESLQKNEKKVTQTIILTTNNGKVSEKTVLTVPGIESKVKVKPLFECDSQKSPKQVSESVKLNGKREVHELSLGDVSNDMKLEEPPGICNSETGRSSDEVKLLKGSQPKLLLEKAKSILKKTTSPIKQDENNRNVKVVNLGAVKEDININPAIRRRQAVDLNRSSTERNFITPVRAMTDFLLKPSDLEGLRKTKRRSPYENDPPITVYWRKDVETKALDVWGSKENLLKEILKRDIERRRYQQNLFTVKRRLRDYRREQGRESEIKLEQNGLLGSSGKVVLTAIAINGTNFMFKLFAWFYTGSHSMFSEAVHSLADTINQLILAYGIHKSIQRADSDHPYGYTNMRYVASLISGVGIFCVGSGLSFYHGFVGLSDPSDLPSFYWAYFILCGSLVSEGATLLVAFNSIRAGARKSAMSLSEYVLRAQDPSVNVVLLEDLAAVIGVTFAGSCMGLSSYYNSHIPDAIGSFLVGGLLAGVASFIIYTNVAALVGRSIPQERLDKINAELESDVMIRAIHDVKGIDIGNSLVRYKAEMDFDGGELTRSYLDKQDLNQMLEEVRKMQTIDELEEFMLKHGENIVDMMGGEIDRIELKLRKKHPEIRHCDLEIL